MKRTSLTAFIFLATSVLCAAESLYVLSVFLDKARGLEWICLLLTYIGFAAISVITKRRLFFVVGCGIVLTMIVSTLGIATVAAALAFLSAAVGYGSITRRTLLRSDAAPNIVFDGIVGLIPLMGICGLLLHFSLPVRTIYTALTVIGLFLSSRVLSASFKSVALDIRVSAPITPGTVAAAALCATATSFTCLASLFPSVNYDDGAFHLRLATELTTYGRALFDVTTQIWAVSPHYGDLFYAIPTVIAGEDTRGAVNLILILVCATVFGRGILAIKKNAAVALLATALFISCPVFFLVGTTMQSELLLTTLAVAAARTLLISPEHRAQVLDDLLTLVAICALMAGIKTTGAMLGVLLLAAWCGLWIMQSRKAAPTDVRPRILPTLLFLGAATFVALHSYVNAYLVTGNPVFPLFNGVFRSPYYAAENFANPIYAHGPSWKSFFEMFFLTSRYLESGDGVAGFQYLALMPAALVGLWIQRSNLRLIAVVTTGVLFFLLMFAQQQYVRYLLPSTALLAWPLLELVTQPSGAARTRLTRWLLIACVCTITLLNLAMAKQVIWYTNTNIGRLFIPSGREEFVQRISAELTLNRIVNQISGQSSRVLYSAHRPFGATLKGTPLYTNWYNPKLSADYAQQSNAKGMTALIDRYRVTHVMVDSHASNDIVSTDSIAENAPLMRMLALRGTQIASAGNISLFALSATDYKQTPFFEISTLIAHDQLMRDGKAAAGLSLPITVDSRDRIYTFSQPLSGDSVLMIEATIECDQPSAFLVQILWNSRTPTPAHYRLAECTPGQHIRVYDVAAVPEIATEAIFYFNSHSSGGAVKLFDYRVSRR